jgi:uncharacterized membrane protein
MINGFVGLSVAGWIHTIFSCIGILVGAEQVLRTRRDRLHKWFGYVYVTCMVIGDLAILTVYRFNGHFNAFHVGALANLLCIAMALQPMLARPRPLQWKLKHYLWICWSYVGLWAAALTEFIIRPQPLPGRGATLVATIVATSIVCGMGAWLIRRHRPAPAPAARRVAAEH